jgi:hypothetical protein
MPIRDADEIMKWETKAEKAAHSLVQFLYQQQVGREMMVFIRQGVVD